MHMSEEWINGLNDLAQFIKLRNWLDGFLSYFHETMKWIKILYHFIFLKWWEILCLYEQEIHVQTSLFHKPLAVFLVRWSVRVETFHEAS